MRVAFCFPGQGSHEAGMGREIAKRFPASAAVYEEASEAAGFDVARVCFEGSLDDLTRTEVQQPALVTTSIACLRAVETLGLRADYVVGHSVGEYSALAACGSLSSRDAVVLVSERGRATAAAAAEHPGAMAAVLGLDDEVVEVLCSGIENVWPANYNCPGQIVVSGESVAVDELIEQATLAGARRAIKLRVSGAFHSPLVARAAERLRPALERVSFADPAPPFMSTVTAKLESAQRMAGLLVDQLTGPVRFTQAVRGLVKEGVDVFVEIGPGSVLSGLVRRCDRSLRTVSVGSPEALAKLEEAARLAADGFCRLDGRVALVTGGSRGIGAAISREAARAGARVALNYRAGAEAATALAGGFGALAVQADVSVPDDVGRLVELVEAELGEIDVLVNNAGITRDTLIARMSDEDWQAVIDTNLKSVFLTCRAVSRRMMKRRRGVIVNLSSVVGVRGNPGQVNYAASKAGLIGLTKSLARELGSRDVRVNALAPGYIETELTGVLSEDVRRAILANTPLGRLGSPEDVAAAVRFLCSDEAAFVTGEVVLVDGGLGI